MIFSDSGVILIRQDFREADRIVSIYTKEHGRLHARLPGVSRPLGKLKALCEPLTFADFRIYTRRNGVIGTVTGGKIHSVFPHIHQDLRRMQLACHCCELLMRLTPLHQPNPAKLDLLVSTLATLDQSGPNHALAAAFTLRLMTLAGFGLDRPVLHISQEFWQKMHEAPLNSLQFTEPEDLLFLAKCNNVCNRFLNRYLTYPLHTVKNIGLTEPEQWIDLPELELQPVH